MITILLIALGILFLCLFFKIFSKPIKWIFKMFLNALIGFAALFVLNLLGGYIGLHISVGWISALVAGVLGFPGIVLLVLVEMFIL